MQSETSRIEAFSDGVFAIAITLLVLELKVPDTRHGSLGLSLLRSWPSYLSFLMSFMFIGVMWINHHRLFTYIRLSTDGLMILNLLLLLGVTSVPFPTAILAASLGGPDQLTAAIVYNAAYVVIALLFNLLWRYAVKNRILDESGEAAATAVSRQYSLGPLMYLVCMALAWVSVPASIGANLALAIFFLIPPHLLRSKSPAA
jgi:uncharacterized membrane protein